MIDRRHSTSAIAFFLAIGGHILLATDTPASGVPVNIRLLAQQRPVAPRPYDSHPAFIIGAHNQGFAVWHSYAAGEEWIVGRSLPATSDTAMINVATTRTPVANPGIAMGDDGSLLVSWASFTGGRWRVMASRRKGSEWAEPRQLSLPGIEALHPAVTAFGNDAFAVAWVEFAANRFRITGTVLQGSDQPPIAISEPETNAFRPAVLTDGSGTVWAFWDSYLNGTYGLQARQLTPTPGPIERITTSPDRCLKAVPICSRTGELIVAWVKITDVVGGEGVIDQRHTIEVAHRHEGHWERLTDEQGSPEAAVLAHGLLAKIAPSAGPTGGYLGRRREPMLVRDGADVWLLWERKTNHAGDTSNATGDLAGRRIVGGRWGDPVLLAQGWVDYHVAAEAETRNGSLAVIASSLPRDGLRQYSPLTITLSENRPLVTEKWTGWSPVHLPLAPSPSPRQTVSEDGENYRLYWMDSHVHSGLTADAEGEPDEIMLYARDRAQLDAMVMQENDFYNCPLTESEYQIGTFYARAFSRDDEFIALPGFEWTQQVPADPSLDKDQARFWRGNYPNHRTVIYPRAGGPLVRYIDVRGDITQLYSAVANAGGVLHTQHPTFDLTNHPVETSIEVSAGWGVYFLNPGRIHETLNAGYRVGFIGTSDSHRRNPGLGGGLTGIYASALTPDAILEAYRAHRVFATSGSRIGIVARANGVLMGKETEASGPVRLTLNIKGTEPIRRATLIRDGVDLYVVQPTGMERSLTFEYNDAAAPPGIHWYYWRVEQAGGSRHYGGNVATALGHLAWSTPNWVRVIQQ